METTIEKVHQEISDMKKDIEFIKNVLKEEYELSDEAISSLQEARNTAESEYIDL